jgi:hypothetical protein
MKTARKFTERKSQTLTECLVSYLEAMNQLWFLTTVRIEYSIFSNSYKEVSFRTEQPYSHRADFREILFWEELNKTYIKNIWFH